MGLTKTKTNKYLVNDTTRDGVRFKDWALEEGFIEKGEGGQLFDKKTDAQNALNQYEKENPTIKESGRTSDIYAKKRDPKKTRVLNYYAKKMYGKKYDDLEGGRSTGGRQTPKDMVYSKAANQKWKIVKIGKMEESRLPFKPHQRAKIVKAFPWFKEGDFKKYPKYGIPGDLPNGKRNPKYTLLANFQARNFKLPPLRAVPLTKKEIASVMDSHELPKGVEWNFLSKDNPEGHKYGVHKKYHATLIGRIRHGLATKREFPLASDLASPKGWMMASMHRVWKNQMKNQNKSDYKPLYNDDKSKIIGFQDNTPAGAGNKFYGLIKNTPKKGATDWNNHPDYKRIVKFVDITERVREDPNTIIQKLLRDKGIEGKIKLNDILSYDRYFNKLSQTAPLSLIKKQIVKHHMSGVGGNKQLQALATKDIQLLTGATNAAITGLEEKLRKNNTLSVEDDLTLKNLGAKIRAPDGKIYGGGFLDPERQFGLIEKQAAEMVKKETFTAEGMKTFQKSISKLIREAEAGGPICGLVRKPGAAGGVQGPGCGDEVRQALQEDPDKLVQEASQAKVKSGESTKFRNIARQILSKLPKGGRLGMLVAGAGALGLGTGAMMADAEAEEPMTIDPWEQEGWEREQDPMRYNATEGRFTRLDGEPVNQQGVLNWIADNPVKSSFAAFPLAYGLGQGANKMGAQRAARFLKGWRAMIPAMMIPEGLTRTREGEGWGELATDPWNAIWALGWDSEASLRQKTQYYKQLAKQTGMTVDDVSLSMKNLKPSNWKKLPTALKNAVMSPRSAGSRMIFPYGRGMSKAVATRAGIGALGRVGAMMAVPIPGARVVGGLMALNELRKKYQFNKDVGAYVDQMRATGHLSEEDADTLRTVYKQGWLGTTGLGAKLLNSEVLQLEGKDIGVEEQARILDSMKLWQDEFREGRREVRSKQREPFFQSFSEGGRVEFAGGGMDRRSFLKWLAALTAGGMGMLKHGWKTPAKQITKEVAKETLTTAKPEMWVPRLIAKIKAEGKLLEMADKKYVHGDIYEVMINGKKVTLEYNPVTKRSQIDWDAPDYDSEMKRSIDYDEGQMIEEGKFAGTREKPEVNFLEPDRSTPYRDDFDNFDWINDSDQVLDDMQKWIGIEDVNPKPTGPRTSNFDFEDGGYDEFNQGGEVETGNIARRPGEVPPLSGPTPQGEGIVGLFSQPKQVRIG